MGKGTDDTPVEIRQLPSGWQVEDSIYLERESEKESGATSFQLYHRALLYCCGDSGLLGYERRGG